jgi:hypothetical protein
MFPVTNTKLMMRAAATAAVGMAGLERSPHHVHAFRMDGNTNKVGNKRARNAKWDSH